MSRSITSIKSLAGYWPRLDDFVAGLNQHIDNPGQKVNAGRVYKWIQRDAIPPEYWYAVIKASEDRGVTVTGDMLILHARDRKLAASA